MENNMHYSEQSTMDSMSMNAALAQSLCIIPRNVIVYCIMVGDRRVPLAPSYHGE